MSEETLTFAKEILYDVEWQSLRIILLKQHNNYGGFSTSEGLLTNWGLLEAYCEATDDEKEAAFRCFRVMNLLAAVMLGYRKATQAALIAQCKHYHEKLAERYKALNWGEIIEGKYNGEILVWDWNKTKSDLEKLWNKDSDLFEDIRRNLDKRVEMARRKERLKVGGMMYRKELEKFMLLMGEVAPRI